MLTLDIMKAQLGMIAANMKADISAGFLGHAERWFRDEVGADLFTWLKTLNGTEAESKELLRLAHSCLAWYAYSLAFPHLKYKVTDLGILKNNPEKSIAVTKWEYIDSRDANLSMLDLSLEYFWKEVELVKPAAFTGSSAYAKRNRCFVRSAAELGDLLPIAGRNYRFFQKLIPHIEYVEDEHLRKAMTAGVFDELKQKWQQPNASLSYQEERLISLVRRAVAYFSVLEAWSYLPLTIHETGISETRSKDGTMEEVAPDSNLRGALKQQLYTDAQKRLSGVIEFLDENATGSVFSSYYLKYLAGGDSRYEADDFTDKPHVIL